MLSVRLLNRSKVCVHHARLSLFDNPFKRGDPKMESDTLFDENFNVRKDVYVRTFNPMIDFVVRTQWKLKQRMQVAFGGPIPEHKSPQEVAERNELMYRLEEFYLEIPHRFPDQQWFSDLIDHYTKYHDMDGAHDIWKWIGNHDIWINMDQEVIDKFEEFFELNEPKSLTKMSDNQLQRRVELLEKFKKMDDNPERWYNKRLVAIDNPKRTGRLLKEGERYNSGGGF